MGGDGGGYWWWSFGLKRRAKEEMKRQEQPSSLSHTAKWFKILTEFLPFLKWKIQNKYAQNAAYKVSSKSIKTEFFFRFGYLFNGISSFMDNQMPKPSLEKKNGDTI